MGKKIAPFILKLYHMVNGSSPLITWHDDTSFNLVKNDDFCTLLGDYFKHNNFVTFLRQLVVYGFTKQTENEILNFSHPNFRRGDPDALSQIERKVSTSQMTTPTSKLSPMTSTDASPSLSIIKREPGTENSEGDILEDFPLDKITNHLTEEQNRRQTQLDTLQDIKKKNDELFMINRELDEQTRGTLNRLEDIDQITKMIGNIYIDLDNNPSSTAVKPQLSNTHSGEVSLL